MNIGLPKTSYEVDHVLGNDFIVIFLGFALHTFVKDVCYSINIASGLHEARDGQHT